MKQKERAVMCPRKFATRSLGMTACSALVGWVLVSGSTFAAVIDFEDLVLASGTFFDGGGVSSPWMSGGATFNNHFEDFGSEGAYGSWYGWAYSNVNDTTKADYQNQYASWTGTGRGGFGNYAIAFDDGYSLARVAFINLPAGWRPASVQVANTTYAALTMRDGDAYQFLNPPFGQRDPFVPDFLDVIVTGYDGIDAGGTSTGSVTLRLADFDQVGLSTNQWLLGGWQELSLDGLSSATRSIAVSFADSRAGLGTPFYAAFDDLTLVAVPEPATAMLVVTGLAAWLVRRRMWLT